MRKESVMSKKNRMIVPSKPNNSGMVEIPTENNEVGVNNTEIIVDAPVESSANEVEKEIIVEEPEEQPVEQQEEVVVVEEPKEEPATEVAEVSTKVKEEPVIEEPKHDDLYSGVKTEKVVEEVIVKPPVEKKQEVKENVPKKQVTNQEPQVYKTSGMDIEHWIVIRKSTLAPKLRARLDAKNIPYVVSDKEDYIFVGPYPSLEEAKKNRKLIRGSGIPVVDVM